MDVITTFFSEHFWATAMILAALTTPITSFLNEKFSFNGVWKQVMAWVVSIILVVVSYFGGMVAFSEPVYLTLPLTGLLVGLSANGIYDIPAIKKALKDWFGILNKEN